MTGESCQIWVMLQVGCSRFTQCHRKRDTSHSEKCRQKPANFIRLFPTCLPILGQEVTSLYVCSVKDPHSNHSPEETILGWTPLLPAAVGKARDLRSQRNWSSLKHLNANEEDPQDVTSYRLISFCGE